MTCHIGASTYASNATKFPVKVYIEDLIQMMN
jgi:hypothetical protein